MRLVEADKIDFKPFIDPFEIPGAEEAVKQAPTVQAIPVEWIEERIRAGVNFALNDPREGTIEEHNGILHCFSGALSAQILMNIIKFWREENEG